MSIVSEHWGEEDVQAHERRVDEKQREKSSSVGGLTLSEVIHNQHVHNIEQGMKNVFATRASFFNNGVI